jgi:hypothetical protein
MAVVPSPDVTGLTALSGQVYLFQIAAKANFGNAAKEEKIMRKLNCKPGDLAIIVEAFNPVNIGAIVKVIGKHRNQRVLCASPEEFIWLIEAPHPLTYEVKGKLVRKRKGGVPDSVLQPIRGLPLGKDITDHLRVKYEMGNFDLRIFDVNDSGTISDPDVEVPEINADLFEFDDYHTVESLIDTIETCQPLLNSIQSLARNKRLEFSEDDDSELKTVLEDEDFGWKEWIRLQGEGGVSWFITYIDETWLPKELNWRDVDYFPSHYSGVAIAKEYFESLDYKTLDALGIDIIEGEYPGSSYYAAELRQDVDYVNQVARDLGLKFRFRQE